jgi:hypothetical protein
MKAINIFNVFIVITLGTFIFSCEKEEDGLLKTGQIEFKTYPDDNQENEIYLELVAQKLTIDWGDGNIEHFSPQGERQGFFHQYDTWSLKNIRISTEGMTHFGPQGTPSDWDMRVWEKHFDELRFSNCPELQQINCSLMGLYILEIDKAESLTTLDCCMNKLIQLNLNGCPSLTNLFCINNRLITLTIDRWPVLKNLWCINNQLTALELGSNKALTMLMCGNNKISNLDLSNHKSLQHFVCNHQNMVYYDGGSYRLKTSKYLYNSYYSTNRRLSLKSSNDDGDDDNDGDDDGGDDDGDDDGGLIAIDTENKTKNPPLTHINLAGCNSLISLSCENNQVADLNVKDCNSLEYLSCKYNELTAATLNTIFESLPINSANEAEIHIKGNLGVDDCNEKVATDKGWKINK